MLPSLSQNVEGEGKAGADLTGRVLVDARAADSDIDRYIFFQLPDRAHESGARLRTTDVAVVKDFCHRAHGPIVRAFGDQADEKISMLFARQRDRSVKMQGAPL